jgi:3-oxoacyl-[acyl-carrier-protein] synthase II
MDIAVIGVGMVDSMGSNPDTCWDNILNGVVGMSDSIFYDKETYPVSRIDRVHMTNIDELDISEHFSDKEKSYMDRAFLLGMYATIQSIKDSNIDSTDVSVIFSVSGVMRKLEESVYDNLSRNKRTIPRGILYGMKDNLSSSITRMYGYTGQTATVSNMCASALTALDYAIRTLEDNEYSIVSGTDSFINPFNLYCFQQVGALSTGTEQLTRPFDVARDGFTMGEGACSFVITTKENAIKRGHKIYGIIKGIGGATETTHETDMSLYGIGSRKAIATAIKKSGISYNDIGYINCHATGTVNGDLVEYNIMSELFPNTVAGANKANIGHTMGACGLLETYYTMKALSTGIAPPIVNLHNPIGNGLILPNKPTTINAEYAIKNSFGFGGKSSSLVVQRYVGK